MHVESRSWCFIFCLIAGAAACGVQPGAGALNDDETIAGPAGESVLSDTEPDEPSAEGEGEAPEETSTAPTEEPEPSDSDDEADVEQEPPSVCEEADLLFADCASPLPDTCEQPAAAECILGTPSAVDGYCAFEAGVTACDLGQPSSELYEWCAIRACLGGDYQQCIATHSAACTSQVCDSLQAVVGQCDGYGYDCESRSEQEAVCLLEVFEALDSPCGLFIDSPLLCMGTAVSEWGWGSCHVQRCTGVSTFESCYANLEILCAATGF
ncbi:MAG: hypothetical protein VX834_12120 [Myxococcota bacterium]|nr:hypothetical protein [Myxococcota bacterium]